MSNNSAVKTGRSAEYDILLYPDNADRSEGTPPMHAIAQLERRRLMAERTEAIAAGDFGKANALTLQITRLPLAGVPELTLKDIDRYVKGRKRTRGSK
jgi:hypothetical protein